jgi:hypothetical protein
MRVVGRTTKGSPKEYWKTPAGISDLERMGRERRDRVTLVCRYCGTGFQRPRSKAHLKCCSAEHAIRLAWKEGGPIARARVEKASTRTKQVRKGSWAGKLGAEFGVKGAEAGRTKGGRNTKLTPIQQQEILRLSNLGLSSRQVAKLVLDDEGLKDRVLRFLQR